MYSLYRVVVPHSQALLAATTIVDLRPLVASLGPGIYVIEEVIVDDKQAKSVCRPWGVARRDADGEVTLVEDQERRDATTP